MRDAHLGESKLEKAKQRIRRIFIANRGEIARRIAFGAQSLGIETVCLYSGEAPPAFLEHLVTQFVKVEEESPALYLNAEMMVGFAQKSACDAVHPGFGFLSENAGFAALVEKVGLTWIGPSPKAISAMASKAAARALAKDHKVPVVPGLEKLDQGSLQAIQHFAKTYGFPILLKAAMGGGGKGMRIVRRDAELQDAVHRAQSEAINAFGDGSLIVERYVEYPRHVEVQILGDQHGNVYALGDRDCSVQRRHQKIIEEAPAPGLRPETRKKMQEAAINLAKAVGYYSAGTVEFLVDWSQENREEENFYFLEMNTRLQVEHPVTEQIFNEDLVVWQLRIAMGESLEGRLHTHAQGHSIELRLYAEDCKNRFMPAPGPVYGFLPFHGPGIRWERGIDAIDEITTRFDPMIAKIVSTGSTREQAIQRLVLALQQTILAVPTSNVSFLLDVLRSPAFTETQATTRFIEDEADALEQASKKRLDATGPLAEKIWNAIDSKNRPAYATSDLANLTRSIFAKNKAETLPIRVSFIEEHVASVPLRYPGRTTSMGRGTFVDNGKQGSFCYCQSFLGESWIRWLSIDGEAFLRIDSRDEITGSGKAGAHAHDVLAPVPGKLVKILVTAGSEVHEKQTLFILESMKMEFEVQATRSGILEEVLVEPGQQVQADALLAHWKQTEA